MEKHIKILRKQEKAIIPQKATSGSAGCDLFACLDEALTIMPGETHLIPTGIAMALPTTDYVGLLFVRSGLAAKHELGLPNGVGVIDSDYRGEIYVSIKNFGKRSYVIGPHDRIAQLVIMPICNFLLTEVTQLSATERGERGFGSTGI